MENFLGRGILKKFQFKLERLLEIRKDREEEQKIVLAKASGEYQKEVMRKQAVLDNVEGFRNQLKSIPNPGLSQYQAYDVMLQHSDAAIAEIDKEIEKRKRVMDREMEIYVKLKQDRRAVELLKEKRYKQYQEEAQKEEGAFLDEIGTNNYLKNKEAGKNTDN